MTRTNVDESENDIFPRDQLEYYKLEVTRLRIENERLNSEVDFLRQALAATLSKIPQVEGATALTNTTLTTPETPAGLSRWSWPHGAPVPAYVRYFSLASLMASPLVLIFVLIFGLICAILFLASIWFLPTGLF